jgi:MFS family permease
VTSAVTALGGLLFGYDTGVVSGALLFVRHDFGGLSSFDQELVTSLLLVGAVVGALVAGRVADIIGRRPSVLITAVIFVVGVLLAAFAPMFWVLLVARFVIGLAVGAASMVVPLYIGEAAPPRTLTIRGAAMSVATIANWAANFVVTISFLTLLNSIGGSGVFFLFGALTLVALAYFAVKVPETKGRSLQQLERDLTGRAVG